MDYNGISRKAYRELATVQIDLLREHFVSEAKKQLDQKMTSFAPIKVISKNFKTTESEEHLLAARSMKDLLPVVMKNITLAPTDILRLKVRFFFFFSSFFPFLKDVIHPLPQVAGDGRNVGRKRKHVMVVFCVFKEGRNVLKANHQHTVNLTVGSEDYDLMKVCEIAFLFVNEGTTPSCRNHLRTSSKT